MASTLAGIGAGLFVLILLWSISIFVCVISSKLKAPFSYIGPGFITLTALITAILLAIPRRKSLSVSPINGSVGEKSPMATEYDWAAYVVLPAYLSLCLVTFGLSSGLLANFYFLREQTQISAINSRRFHFSN